MEYDDPAYCAFCDSQDLMLLDDEGVFFVLCLDCRASGPLANSAEEAHLLWCDRPLSDDPEYVTIPDVSKTTH
jgi:hypothetical protein